MDQGQTSTLWSTRRPFQDAHAQYESALFRLPGELRDQIYTYALTPYEDQDQPYGSDTCYYRPGYTARRRTDLSLLRTCKRVYSEAWCKPLSLATEFCYWLAWAGRAPQGEEDLSGRLAGTMDLLQKHHGYVELKHVQIFAQMLEFGGRSIDDILMAPHFHPAVITITVRHTDWWSWEDDDWLRYDAGVRNSSVFPASTRKLVLEMETLERKKDQLDSIVSQMKDLWAFSREDGVLLSARRTETEMRRWQGSSTWEGSRWIRDEVEPGLLDYCKSGVNLEQ